MQFSNLLIYSKKVIAAALVLTLVWGAVPIPPVADMFGDMVITANAAQGDLTDFLTVSSSGTATGYFTFENHFYKVDWFGINTTETTSVLFHYSSTYDDLEAERNGNTKDSILLSPIAETSTFRWNASYIRGLTPGQHSDGYTTSHDLSINADTEGEKSAKVCTITCMAANAPTWSWSADHSTCTAAFTCTEDPSLTATVNAAVTEANHIRTASAVFNGINYSDSMLIPEQDGSTYIIQNETGWDLFCDLLANSDKGFFDGKTVKLDADITIKKSAGSSGHGFTGTFDGQEYTLTVADNYSYAPFCYVDNGCVIEKLHTDGIVRAVVSGTSRTNASGLIDTLTGNVTVRNCCSSVMIYDSNTNSHQGKHGGLVGKTNSGSSVTIEGCIFNGKMATIIPRLHNRLCRLCGRS